MNRILEGMDQSGPSELGSSRYPRARLPQQLLGLRRMCRQQVSVLNKKFMLNVVPIVEVAFRQADCLFVQDGAILPVLVERKAVRDLVGSSMQDHLSLGAADVEVHNFTNRALKGIDLSELWSSRCRNTLLSQWHHLWNRACMSLLSLRAPEL